MVAVGLGRLRWDNVSDKDNIGRVKISVKLILDSLHFPEGTEVLACNGEGAAYHGEIELVVRHKDLPLVAKGGKLPLLVPSIGKREVLYTFNWF